MNYPLTTAMIETINENFISLTPEGVRAKNIMQNYRDGLITATDAFNQLVGLREQDKTFFRRMDQLTNGEWTRYVLLLAR